MDDRTKYTLGKQKSPDVYSAPRRYDLATMLVVTTAFAMLFTGMTLLDFEPWAFLYFAGLVVVIGGVQSVTAGKHDPRRVSMVVGVVYYLGVLFFLAVSSKSGRPTEILCSSLSVVIVGPVQGYLGGALVAGTFLVADLLRGFLKSVFGLYSKQSDEGEKKRQSPWDD